MLTEAKHKLKGSHGLAPVEDFEYGQVEPRTDKLVESPHVPLLDCHNPAHVHSLATPTLEFANT